MTKSSVPVKRSVKAKKIKKKMTKAKQQRDKTEETRQEIVTKDVVCINETMRIGMEIPEETDHQVLLSVPLTAWLNSESELPEKIGTPVKRTSGVIKRKTSFTKKQSAGCTVELMESVDKFQMLETAKEPSFESNEAGNEKNDAEKILMQQIAKMSAEELEERIFSCTRLCIENKINIKNAFSLHLIDWLIHLMKHKHSTTDNFAVLACTLDAGAKIYSHRVDIVHREVLKLVTVVASPNKSRKGIQGNKEKTDDGQMLLTGLKKKGTTLVSNAAVLQHKCTGKNPFSKFVKVGALPGDLMEVMLKTDKTFSIETPFRLVCKVPCLLGKLVRFKLKQYNHIDCSLSRICDQLLGRTAKNTTENINTESVLDCMDCGNESDTSESANDLSFNMLLAEFDATTGKPKDILDSMIQKVDEAKLVDIPKPFDKLTRMEKLSLILMPSGDVLVNPHLEELLYGPLHLRKPPVLRRNRPVRCRKMKSQQLLNFAIGPGEVLTELSAQVKSKTKSTKPILKRTTLTLRTVNNWSEVKTMGPEEIIINKNFLHELRIRKVIIMKESSKIVSEDEGSETENRDEINCHEPVYCADVNMEEKLNSGLLPDDGEVEKLMKKAKENNALKFTNEMDMCEPAAGKNQKVFITENSQFKEKERANEDTDGNYMNFTSYTCSYFEEPTMLKFLRLNCLATSRCVNMKGLKGAIKDILDEARNNDNILAVAQGAGENTKEELTNEFQTITFSELYSQVRGRLYKHNRSSVTPHMTFVALLHIASESELVLENRNNNISDQLIIKKMKDSDSRI